MIAVWRRRPGGDQVLEVADGKRWRLPHATEVGLPRVEVDGPIPFVAESPSTFDPGRTHRWVPVDASSDDVRRACAQAPADAEGIA